MCLTVCTCMSGGTTCHRFFCVLRVVASWSSWFSCGVAIVRSVFCMIMFAHNGRKGDAKRTHVQRESPERQHRATGPWAQSDVYHCLDFVWVQQIAPSVRFVVDFTCKTNRTDGVCAFSARQNTEEDDRWGYTDVYRMVDENGRVKMNAPPRSICASWPALVEH